ncbi:hypothetical protein ACH5RR_024804 [Cinchona calisaya]|uniref:Uncharacterized protein n=1 Tax=Cinchona calisaya TaxID=153742 RepID=A0ABD2Z1Y4_9GENT
MLKKRLTGCSMGSGTLCSWGFAVIKSDGKNVVPDVWTVLDKIREFSESVCSGAWEGDTGKPLKDVAAIGIGASFLGPLFLHTALQTDPKSIESAGGRQLHLLCSLKKGLAECGVI